jgi:hypothetical protein
MLPRVELEEPLTSGSTAAPDSTDAGRGRDSAPIIFEGDKATKVLSPTDIVLSIGMNAGTAISPLLLK